MCMLRLTLEQKELCRSRLKLLSYLDRLATYEVTTPVFFFYTSVFRNNAHSLFSTKVIYFTIVENT